MFLHLISIEFLNIVVRIQYLEFFFSFILICLNEEEKQLDNNPSIDIAKKEIQKAIINELCKKVVIEFCQCNNIIKKLDEDIIKLENKLDNKKEMKNMIVKIPI